jgi:putative ABC transport system permease protein
MALAAAAVVNQFLRGGLRLEVTPGLLAEGISLAGVVATSSGIYPAWRASKLLPMEAIRRGAR